MRQPLAFISHSSKDKPFARSLTAALRKAHVDAWIDEEQIRFGDSIPGAIDRGLSTADAILILISRSFVASSWCRAEYEPLLAKEIERGRTIVIPVRLDDAKVPTILSAKRYVDLRRGLQPESVEELAITIRDMASVTRVNHMLPQRKSRSAGTTLGLIVGSILKEFPVESLAREEIVDGRSVLDLYRAVEALIDRFQSLFEELVAVLSEAAYGKSIYGSARRINEVRLQEANRKLRRVAGDMRELSQSFRTLVKDGPSDLLARVQGVLELCATISVEEDFLVVQLGAPLELPETLRVGEDSKGPVTGHRWGIATGEVPGLGVTENPDVSGEAGSVMLKTYQECLVRLDDYRVTLRKAVADVVAAS